MRKYSAVLYCLLIAGCAFQSEKNGVLIEEATLGLDEVSGLIYTGITLFAIQDSGNKNKLYSIDSKTGKHDSVKIKGTKNTDWEDLAKDANGNVYIGDFGNNDNDQRNLAIYKVAGSGKEAEYTVKFYYPEQKDFPPKKKQRNFDCEAFFEHEGYFWLFTKNRSTNSNGLVTIYKVKNSPGNQEAVRAGSFTTCGNYRGCAIAGADISPDGKTVALISGDRLWLLSGFKDGNFAEGTLASYELGELTQKEGICFKDNETLYIADERNKNTGGKLYSLKLAGLKAN